MSRSCSSTGRLVVAAERPHALAVRVRPGVGHLLLDRAPTVLELVQARRASPPRRAPGRAARSSGASPPGARSARRSAPPAARRPIRAVPRPPPRTPPRPRRSFGGSTRSRPGTSRARPSRISSTEVARPSMKARSCDTNTTVPGNSAQRAEQHVLGGDVEVVGRLVEHEEVRRPQEQQQHAEAALLAAAQDRHGLQDVVAPEEEGAEHVPQLRHERDRGRGLDLLDHGAVARPRVGLLLGVPGEGHPGAPDHRPGVGRSRARRGSCRRVLLPAPFTPTTTSRSPRPSSKPTSGEHRPARVRLGERPRRRARAGPDGGAAGNEKRTRFTTGGTSMRSRRSSQFTRLCTRRAFEAVVAEPADERLDPGDLLLLQPVALHDRLELAAPHLLVVRVGAREHRHPGHPDLRHPGHRDVEEVPVVGHHEHAARDSRAGCSSSHVRASRSR